MKAVFIKQYGGVGVLTLEDTIVPEPTENEILVKVHACGLNPVDFKIRAGHLRDLVPVKFPRILGGDISGSVVKVGQGVQIFRVGDEVYFSNPLDKDGGYAEFCVVDEKYVSHKPKNLTHLEAATLPVGGLTAIQTLRDYSKISQGKKVLIHAGAGGVGSFAIQYAKKMGAVIFTTASFVNHKYVKDLGADVVISYHREDFVSVCQKVGGMDIILESIGGDNYIESIRAVKYGGYVPCIANSPDEASKNLALQKKVSTDFVLLNCSHIDLDEITNLVDLGAIKPIASQIISFEEIIMGHKLLESGRVRGKLVLQVM